MTDPVIKKDQIIHQHIGTPTKLLRYDVENAMDTWAEEVVLNYLKWLTGSESMGTCTRFFSPHFTHQRSFYKYKNEVLCKT